ncbi:MAG TPA: hypothetical protein DCS93_34430 [Microscillaceae bacterium]|nr:hypothetical protein [Microscillaceae bacterium]
MKKNKSDLTTRQLEQKMQTLKLVILLLGLSFLVMLADQALVFLKTQTLSLRIVFPILFFLLMAINYVNFKNIVEELGSRK